jgi:hypothetical protein
MGSSNSTYPVEIDVEKIRDKMNSFDADDKLKLELEEGMKIRAVKASGINRLMEIVPIEMQNIISEYLTNHRLFCETHGTFYDESIDKPMYVKLMDLAYGAKLEKGTFSSLYLTEKKKMSRLSGAEAAKIGVDLFSALDADVKSLLLRIGEIDQNSVNNMVNMVTGGKSTIISSWYLMIIGVALIIICILLLLSDKLSIYVSAGVAGLGILLGCCTFWTGMKA